MSFTSAWLSLREAADRRARNEDVLAALRSAFVGRAAATVVDLGCGTGSNLRATAPLLPQRQRWRLVDHDAALLSAARERLGAWADTVRCEGDRLALGRDGRQISVSFMQADLAGDLDPILGEAPDLVTAAALFDLVSVAWIGRFARAVASREATVYAALTYDGRESWSPPHADDAEMLAAFHAHQQRDKGFGPSAGPAAHGALARAFEGEGYRIISADSAWRLGAADAALMRELARGSAEAVGETGRMSPARVADWLAARLSASACTIGHSDLLALRR
jgi:SAM-dependent methyltransferase